MLHLIAMPFVKVLKFEEAQHPRDAAGRFTAAAVQVVSERILQASGGKLAVLDLRAKPSGDVELETIAVAPGEGHQGVGTTAMESLVEWADEVGARLLLSPSPKGYQPVLRGLKTTSTARLKKFYKRFGFVEPKGRHYDPTLSSPLRPTMFRPPRVKKFDASQPRDARGRWTWGSYDTKSAIREYTLGDARYINEHLRAGKGPRWDNRKDVRLMDEHMSKNPLLEDTKLTRTVPNSVVKGLEVGDIYQDNGFVSTTKNPAVIDDIRLDIGAMDRERQSTLTILAPKGLGHIDVNQELGVGHDYDHQEEMILPRGLRYQVVKKIPGQMIVQVLQ